MDSSFTSTCTSARVVAHTVPYMGWPILPSAGGFEAVLSIEFGEGAACNHLAIDDRHGGTRHAVLPAEMLLPAAENVAFRSAVPGGREATRPIG